MLKVIKQIEKEIEQITEGERFITQEQLEEIELINNAHVENCGLSGTGKGLLFTVYLMEDDTGDPDYNNEITEFVVVD